MIKAVIFDMGGVLVRRNWQVIYKKIAKELKIPKEKVRKIIGPLLDKWDVGKINEREFWKGFEKRLDRKMDRRFTKDLWFRSYKDYTRNISGTWKILAELRAKRFRLAILSNTIPPHIKAHRKTGRINKLRKLGVELFIFSCKEGIRKPEPKIYKAALKKLNLPAKACVFIDDQIENIEVAKKLGMEGIHFQTPGKLRKELIKLGLL